MYLGYELNTIIGFEKHTLKFNAPTGPDHDNWSFFVRALVGFAGYGVMLGSS